MKTSNCSINPPRGLPAALLRLTSKFPVVAFGVVAFAATLATSHAQTDLALNKTIVADSVEMTGREANKANDGSSTTRWSSNFSGSVHWIYVDLGSAQSITRVRLNWEAAYARDYVVQRSTDAANWTTMATVTGNASAGVRDHTGLSGTGRYVRVYSTLPSVWGNISLFDFNVYGGGSAPLPNGTYTLTPANATSKRLDVSGPASANGTNVHIWAAYSTTSQQWIFTNVSGNIYRLSPGHATGQCLDVSASSTTSGANVHIWQFLDAQNQKWALTAVSGGYTLTPQHATGLRLNSTGTGDGANVNVTTANGSTAQTWNIVAAGGGTAPAAPNLQSATPGNGQVALGWSASSGATSYSVYRSTTANNANPTLVQANITTTSFTNTGLTNGTTYYFKVRAVNAVGSSGFSNELSAIPTAGGGIRNRWGRYD